MTKSFLFLILVILILFLSNTERSIEHDLCIDPLKMKDNIFDLKPLEKAIGNSRIVILGEPSHGDGSVFEFKQELIKYLYEKMGFTVLALEAGQYDMFVVDSLMESSVLPMSTIENYGVLSFWKNNAQIRPIFDFVKNTKSSSNPMTICGFDPQLTASKKMQWIQSVTQIFKTIHPKIINDSFLVRINNDYKKALSELSNKNETILLEDLNRLYIVYQVNEKIISSHLGYERFTFLKETIKDQIVQRQYLADLIEASKTGFKVDMNNPRDKRMAENMLYIVNKRFPGKKIIFNIASLHALYRPELIKDSSGNATLASFTSCGKIFFEQAKQKIFSLGFTAATGSYGSVYDNAPHHLSLPKNMSIEQKLLEKGHEVAFINTTCGKQSENTHSYYSRLLGYEFLFANWSTQLDGIVYFKKMTPVAKIQ